MTNGLPILERPLASSVMLDGHLGTKRHVHPAFIPSTTLSSLVEAQATPLLPELSTPIEDHTTEDPPLIYGFPAHWFGIISTGTHVTTSDLGDDTPSHMCSSNPTITISAPISSPKPTPFGIDSSWMSCSEASTSFGLRHSSTSSWLHDDNDDFPRSFGRVAAHRARGMLKDLEFKVDAGRLSVGARAVSLFESDGHRICD